MRRIICAFAGALFVLAGCSGGAEQSATTTTTELVWGTAVEAFTPTTTTTTRPRVRSYSVSRPATVTEPSDATWERLRICECPSGWHCNTGNGYFGGLQMDMDFWKGYGGLAYASHPHLASREQQIAVALNGWRARGFSPWPTCRRKLGL